MRRIASFPDVIAGAALAYEPHRIAFYLQETIAAFHSYYTQGKRSGERVISADPRKTAGRLFLCRALKQVLANGLAVEWDMYVASGYDWNWGTGGIASSAPNLSVARGDGSFLDNVACDPGYLAWVHLIDDNAYGSRPPYLHVGVIGADGVGEPVFGADTDLQADSVGRGDFLAGHGDVGRPDVDPRDGRRAGPGPVAAGLQQRRESAALVA